MSRTKSRNPQQLKDVLMFLVLIFNYLTKFVAPIRRNILYLKYVQFLKTNSNKESAVLTFIDFAFFSAENLFFSSFDQTCGNNTQHSTWQAKQACFCYTEMLLRRARALNCCLAQLLPCTAAIHSTMDQILRKITEVYYWTLESIFSYFSLYYKKILDMAIINIIPMLFGNR